MLNKNIFRNKALEKMSAPEEFDVPLKIVNLRSWIFLLLLFAVMAAVFLWLSFSKVNQEIESRGIIVKEEHLTEVLAVRNGFIDNIFYHPSDSINKGDIILSLVSSEDMEIISDAADNTAAALSGGLYNEISSRSAVRSPADGILFEQIVSQGSYVRVGDKLLVIEKEPGEDQQKNFEVTGFVPGRIINAIKEGTRVLISPRNIDVKEYGYLEGEVTRIAGYPVSQERIDMLEKKNPMIFGNTKDKIFEVTIIPRTVNNLQVWTSSKKPSIKFINGTLVDLKIIINTKSIFSYIVN